MFRTRVIVTVLWLFVPLAHCFSWDIVVGKDNRLEFYYNLTLTHTEYIPSANHIQSVTYDPVNYRVLFADYNSQNLTISSFDLSTRKIQPIVTKEEVLGHYTRVVYDPVTQLLFWKEFEKIYSYSLNPASSNKAVDGNLLFKLDSWCYDIAVDSCGGYIYWITNYGVERARFDGSERESLLSSYINNRRSLAIDQQTQKIYWTETIYTDEDDFQLSIESANFNGENRTTFHVIAKNRTLGHSLAVSKDFIYWENYKQMGIWQLPKVPSQHADTKLFSISSSDCASCNRIAANYTIKEQIKGIKSCEALQYLIPNDSKPESEVSVCQNYCFQGDCSVSTEGQPTCSCKAGYSGERCDATSTTIPVQRSEASY